jgi:hypothetical protein
MLGKLFACFGNVDGKAEGRKKVLPKRGEHVTQPNGKTPQPVYDAFQLAMILL